jgi:hypothetical protein
MVIFVGIRRVIGEVYIRLYIMVKGDGSYRYTLGIYTQRR